MGVAHEPQAGEIIGNFPASASRGGGNIPAFFNGADLFEGKRISFNRRGGMGITNPAVFLKGRDPRHLDCGGEDSFAQGGDLLDLGEEGGRDLVTGCKGHES